MSDFITFAANNTFLFGWLTAMIIIGIAIIIVLVGVTARLRVLIEAYRYHDDNVRYIGNEIENMISASKRVEKLVDAINQRTRAHLPNKRIPQGNTENKGDKKTFATNRPLNNNRFDKNNKNRGGKGREQVREKHISRSNSTPTD